MLQFDVCCKGIDQNFDCGCDRYAISRLDSLPNDATPPNFAEKTIDNTVRTVLSMRKLSRIATKPRNSRKFSPSKVFRYAVCVL